MGLAITSLLAAVASELAISAQLPNAEGEYFYAVIFPYIFDDIPQSIFWSISAPETNWFVIFSMTSMMFSGLIIFQSTFVIYFYYFTGSSLKPFYIKWVEDKWRSWRTGDKEDKPKTDESEASEHGAGNGDDTPSMDLTDHMNANLTKSNGDKTSGHHPTNSHVSFSRSASEEEQRAAAAQYGDGSFSSLPATRHDAEDFQDATARENNLRWQRVSRRIDDYSRLIIPLLYLIFLAVILPSAVCASRGVKNRRGSGLRYGQSGH